MALGKFVSYLRVSTRRQGDSGLGLEAQRKAVADYLNGGRWELVAEFVEVESGTKSDKDRPALAAALRMCRIHGATLVVAKFDRLSRNAAFLLTLRDAGVPVVAADRPNAGNLEVGLLAVIAEDEARRISQRTREALQAAKARGKVLGNPRNLNDAHRAAGSATAAELRTAAADQRAGDLLPLVDEIRSGGVSSLRGIAAELERRGVPTARGGKWTPVQVSNLLKRAG